MVSDKAAALVEEGDRRYGARDYRGALQSYEHALRLAPRDPVAWNNKGVALSSLDRFEEAIKCYEKAVELRPNYWMALFNMGKARQKLGQLEEAVDCYDRALDLRPDHLSSMNNKAVALRRLGHEDEALEIYDELLAADPFYKEGWHNKGTLLAEMGLQEEAQVCFDMESKIIGKLERAAGHPPGAAAGKPAARPPTDEGAEAEGPDVAEGGERDAAPAKATRKPKAAK